MRQEKRYSQGLDREGTPEAVGNGFKYEAVGFEVNFENKGFISCEKAW